ncbi:hypothetical protein [Hyperthermus butylicus]|uniref:Uncharacterized protein n=1 Tax=Hyperthermus butylicus (strain DSM 5456 / JCM 9403 / PLM1-5) TaxID=415426 RepID=A2BK93_HYPBU|nr:hypothetical protein [Hyperthermus butylicus]ABM80404.1 hypothetical protein Hbut_0544 [Hyperthermus butylicus DSM 5456]
MYELASQLAARIFESRPRLRARTLLALAYAAAICRIEGCDATQAAAATVAIVEPGEADRLKPAYRSVADRAAEEAADAALRAPQASYTRVALDADVLSRIGAISLLTGEPARSFSELLSVTADALSYAVASDYILYTAAAKRLASRLKPHTMAYAKWLVEELQELGLRTILRIEAVYEGHIAYLDLLECPCGGKPEKMATLKPLPNCVEYSVSYTCRSCDEEYGFKICIPETTRTR